MVIQKGQVLNPRGNPNPNIRDLIKTGPKTDEGKLRSVLSSGLLKTGANSKLIKKMRKSCATCPLGSKCKKIKKGDKEMEYWTEPQCPFYKKGKRKCEVPVADYTNKIKLFYEFIDKDDTIGLQKALIFQSIADGEMNRERETLKDGSPKFYTKEFGEQSLKYITELNKLKFGAQRHQHLHVGEDSAEKLMGGVFREKKEDEEEK